jgi:ABC-2 type transport system permease protein
VITHIIPARYFVAILKGLFLKGSGIRILYADGLFLLVFGIITFTIANVKFKKRLG